MFKDSSQSEIFLESVLNRYPFMVTPDTTVIEVISTMNQLGISDILIAKEETIVGIFTQADIVRLVVAETPLEQVSISQVMRQNFLKILSSKISNIHSLITLFYCLEIMQILVLDEGEKLLGIVTPASLRKALISKYLLEKEPVEKIMGKAVITAPTTKSVFELAQQMAAEGKSYAIICNIDDYWENLSNNKSVKPVGIITETDIIKLTIAGVDIRDTSAGKVINSPLISVRFDAPLWQVNQIMEKHGICQLVVLDEGEFLAGIVTENTLLEALGKVTNTIQIVPENMAEKNQYLTQNNELRQQKIIQMQQAKNNLGQAWQNWGYQVDITTEKLTSANAQLQQEILARIEAEREVRRINLELEERFRERTAQMAAINEELEQEIRERQLLEEKLYVSERKIRTVLEAMTDIVLVLDASRNLEILPTNAAVYYPPECDIFSETIQTFFEDETAADWWQTVDQVLETQQGIYLDYSLSLETHKFWFSACISPLSKEQVIWVARDISERKRSEAALQEKNQELANTLQQLQYTQQELIHAEKMAALGQLIAGIAHEINTPLGAIASSARNLKQFLSNFLQEIPEFLHQLSPENMQLFVSFLGKHNQDSQLISSKERRQRRKVLEKQLQSLGVEDFESIARTLSDLEIWDNIEVFLPLFQIQGNDKFLQIADQFFSANKSATIINMATEKAGKVIYALKNYARYDRYSEKVNANIKEGIETVLTIYQSLIRLGVEVRKNYNNDLILIPCYPDEINQVWTNLIHNALQAMEYKGILEIDIEQIEGWLLVKIADTGPGIPAEILHKIFDPFFTTKPPGEGSGLGLDIAKKIVEKHSGKITVDSIPGKTLFTVSIPVTI